MPVVFPYTSLLSQLIATQHSRWRLHYLITFHVRLILLFYAVHVVAAKSQCFHCFLKHNPS
jgi:threonine/homoserine/homoserine lactone efflux protein